MFIIMRLSKFFHSVQIADNVYAIFNSLLMDILFVSGEELKEIHDFSFRDCNILREYGIYVESPESDIEALNIVRRQYLELNRQVNVMYFIVSTGCNLRCKYCFEENSVHNNHCEQNMSLEVALTAARKYVHYIKNNKISNPQIIFYGGEPLVNWNVIKSVIEYLKKEIDDITFSIVTNGTLINDDIASFLHDNKIDVGISIDGPLHINDKNRIFRNSTESVYLSVIDKIQILKKHSVNFGLSITVSEAIIEHQDEVIKWIKENDVQNIFYNLLHYGKKEEGWESFYEKLSQYLIKSHEDLVESSVFDGRISRKIDSLLDKRFKFADCAAIGANQLTIKPNGDVTICHGFVKTDKYLLGNIMHDEIAELIEHPSSKTWVEMSPILREECLTCEAIYVCGAGCSMQAEALFDSLSATDKPFCIHTKKTLLWLLMKLYKASIGQI